MNNDARRKSMTLFRGLRLLSPTVTDIQELRKVALNPQLVTDAETRYGAANCPRSCDGCKGVGFSHIYCEFGSEPNPDGIDLCPPCLLKVQNGLSPCKSIVETDEFDVCTPTTKMFSPTFVTNHEQKYSTCSSCSSTTLSCFRTQHEDYCPVCYALSETGSIFVENIVEVINAWSSIDRLPLEDRASARILYDFLETWDGEGDFEQRFIQWSAVNRPQLEIIVPQNEADALNNTTSTA